MKVKSLKKALICSVMSLVMCFSMLIGTTFAWFTDIVTNNVNQIVSGHFNVELYHTTNYSADATNYETVKNDTALFDELVWNHGLDSNAATAWQPGVESTEGFKIENNGSLPLKYSFSLNFTNATTTTLGKTLADVLVIAVEDENGEVDSYNGTSVLKNFVYSGVLNAGESYEFTSKISWPQGASDNEFNVAGGLKINIGVALVATQLNDVTKIVSTEEELLNAFTTSGSYILANNFNINVDTPLNIAKNTNIELDLNGFSILGNGTQAKTTSVINNNGNLIINDNSNTGSIELTTAVVSSNYSYATNTILNNGSLTLNGGTIKNNLTGASYGIDNNVGATTIVNDGSVINNGTAIRAYSWSGNFPSTVVINGGYIEGAYAVQTYSLGTGYVADIDITINDGTLVSTNTDYPFAIYSYHYDSKVNTDIIINGGTFYGDIALGAGYKGDVENITVDYANTTIYGDIFRYTSGDTEYIYETTETLAVVSTVEQLKTAVANAQDGEVIGIATGTYDFNGETITVGNSINFVGFGNLETVLHDVTFDIYGADSTHAMNVSFDNLKFEGVSRIIVGTDRDNIGGNEYTAVGSLTVTNCYAKTTFESDSLTAGKGQFIYLRATYSFATDLTLIGNTFINAHTIAGEDSAPVVNGNGTVIRNVYIANNTFGDAENPCDRYAVKFARRMDNTNIVIENNIVYGATTSEKDFAILDLWQSGGTSYDGLNVTVNGNTIHCTPDTGKAVYGAYIEATIKGTNIVITADCDINDLSVKQ